MIPAKYTLPGSRSAGGRTTEVPVTTSEPRETGTLPPSSQTVTLYRLAAPSAGRDQESVGVSPTPACAWSASRPAMRGCRAGPSVGTMTDGAPASRSMRLAWKVIDPAEAPSAAGICIVTSHSTARTSVNHVGNGRAYETVPRSTSSVPAGRLAVSSEA
ncbi:hypothetical protein [Anaeromyxobacter oryzae]|uniref:hypothetical protein n=1 Tax=Anaeromyxobacter oryzae TaxID=2918170 RepID=UPI00384D9914